MSKPIPIRMAGYGPPTTGFSKALKFIGDKLQGQFGGRVAIEYVWNIMDHGYKAEDILTLVENGEMTLGYQSSSYLTDRVPELGFVDLPFLFASNAQARASMDGALGAASRAQDRGAHRLPHPRLVRERLPPHLQPAAPGASAGRPQGHEDPRAAERDPAAHVRTARRACAMRMDLTEAIAMIKAGTLDAQENPLANTVTYGVHKFHKFHTLTYHFYISRPIFLHRASFDAWPDDLKAAMQKAVTEAVAFQRPLAVEEHESSRKIIEEAGCEIVELNAQQHAAFVAAVQPLLADGRKMYGEEMFKMVAKA